MELKNPTWTLQGRGQATTFLCMHGGKGSEVQTQGARRQRSKGWGCPSRSRASKAHGKQQM